MCVCMVKKTKTFYPATILIRIINVDVIWNKTKTDINWIHIVKIWVLFCFVLTRNRRKKFMFFQNINFSNYYAWSIGQRLKLCIHIYSVQVWKLASLLDFFHFFLDIKESIFKFFFIKLLPLSLYIYLYHLCHHKWAF